jgi:hypothetical protein
MRIYHYVTENDYVACFCSTKRANVFRKNYLTGGHRVIKARFLVTGESSRKVI